MAIKIYKDIVIFVVAQSTVSSTIHAIVRIFTFIC